MAHPFASEPESEGERDRFREGRHFGLFRRLGCQLDEGGARFAVWAPNARRVSVIGDWNDWGPDADPLEAGEAGVWWGWRPGVEKGARYKFRVEGADGRPRDKTDPFALYAQVAPETASVTWDLEYEWGDGEWMERRRSSRPLEEPLSIYEVHLGSWRRDEEGGLSTYRDLAPRLADYVREMGFSHVELLPVMEHPFYASWGYQVTGYFAPTSRYGTPQDLMFLVDTLHQAGIGVILDWVPSHFPDDPHGLSWFDGTPLFEPADPRESRQPDWGSLRFDYGRGEVRSFLLSSAAFWIDRYHLDGLRVDAVASMIYLDFSREPGEWTPNRYGGRENLEAVELLQTLNRGLHDRFPGVVVVAEESTAWSGVTAPTEAGGLEFDLKWDMGWMHDTLEYFRLDPVYRSANHDKLTFRMMYAYSERFCLALSHDEVVHGKRSLLAKMPGDRWQRAANLRLLLAYQWTLPGAKLLFMGGELGQEREWDHDRELDWGRLESETGAGIQRWVEDLNRVYRDLPPLHRRAHEPRGFRWLVVDDRDRSVFAYLRLAEPQEPVLVVLNATPVVREEYRISVPVGGAWKEVLNSDGEDYGGSGVGNLGRVETEDGELELVLPPLGAVLLIPEES
ncbi:MAG: 1,4-alpha-glucan branching protein GlgB [Thermoanaerobaculia bacterium]|nr:1,4-alpha-glucan branching protein GlgB [Thermoanaerobaculia bacterium]